MSGDCCAVVVVSRTSIRMVVRREAPEDSRAIATIHVLSWQAAYEGVVPAQFLASMSIDRREGIWRQRLEQGASGTWVIEEHGAVLGWISTGPSRDTDALSSTANCGPSTSIRCTGAEVWGNISGMRQRIN